MGSCPRIVNASCSWFTMEISCGKESVRVTGRSSTEARQRELRGEAMVRMASTMEDGARGADCASSTLSILWNVLPGTSLRSEAKTGRKLQSRY
jgi:hypothetical protein